METRRLSIDQKDLVILDDEDLGEEFDEFRNYIFEAAPFHLSQADTYESFYVGGPYWAYTIKAGIFEKTETWKHIKLILQKYYWNLDWEIAKVHVNATQYGDSGFAHPDGSIKEGHNRSATVLIYLNKDWEKDWSGETIFYDQTGDAVGVVMPKFKRIAVFDGSILHAARPPSRSCLYRRMILAIKCSAKDRQDD